MGTRFSRLPLSLWLIALVCVAGLMGIGAELWARKQRPQLPGWAGDEARSALMTGHPSRLWGMEPGDWQNGRSVRAQINSLGLRGDLPIMPRKPGRPRILTLGDSAFFGFGVKDEEVFTTHLERFFADRGIGVDVINGGVAGYSIAQSRVLLEEVGWDLDPTLIVYCNVWSDNTWDTFNDEDLLVSHKFARFNPLTHSSAVKLLAAKLSTLRDPKDGRVITWSNVDGWPKERIRRVPLIRWAAIHDELMRLGADRGVGSVFLRPSNTFLIGAAEDPGPPPAWHTYFDAMDAIAAHHQVPVVDATEAFKAALDAGLGPTDLFMDLMHPTPEGHRRMAEQLGEALLDAGWPGNPLLAAGGRFESETLQDVPNPEWFDDGSGNSHQTRLFQISANTEQDRKAHIDKKRAEGPPLVDGPEKAAVPSDGHWSLEISLGDAVAPISLLAEDGGGHRIHTLEGVEEQQLQLSIRGDVPEVIVRADDASGRQAEHRASPASPHIALIWAD